MEGVAHHVTQHGNRRQQVFFGDDDYRAYRTLLAAGCRDAGVEVRAYCLMPNHVHLILTPSTRDGLRAALAEAHRRYTRAINLREGWRGYLWQGRFASVAMDEAHMMAAARYVELNPVRARLARRADEWPWSSAHAHLAAMAWSMCVRCWRGRPTGPASSIEAWTRACTARFNLANERVGRSARTAS
jgi:putative transposase